MVGAFLCSDNKKGTVQYLQDGIHISDAMLIAEEKSGEKLLFSGWKRLLLLPVRWCLGLMTGGEVADVNRLTAAGYGGV